MHTPDPLLSGHPRFSDTEAARLDAEGRRADAWSRQWQSPGGVVGVQGDFAIGVTPPDGRTRLAVDRFAMQTICWRQDSSGVHFAERADALVPPGSEIDTQAVFDYLFFHVIPSPRTIWKGVHRLPPGHALVADTNRLSVEPYWCPTFTEPARADFAALSARFRDLLRSAVGSQLDGTKPACFLSGGTDSSTVAGMIGAVSGRQAATYSIGFEAEGYDEMEFARIAARHFGTEHHEYYVTPADLVRSVPKVAASYDQPFGNSSVLPAYYCALMARDNGVSRLLAGDGGDELFGGNVRYAKQRVFRAYDGIPRPLRSALVDPVALSEASRRLPVLKKLHSYVTQAQLGLPARLESYNLLLRLGLDEVLTRSFLDSVDAQSPAAQQSKVWSFARTDDPVNRHLAFDWRYTLGETDIPKVRGATTLAGVSVGYPMLDQELVDFSLSLPSSYKLRGVKLRWFFKEALRGFLPDEIITKKKQGFGLPFGPWAVRNAELLALATDSLHALADRGVVRRTFIERLLREFLPLHPGYYGEMVWILMMLEQWLIVHAPNWKLGGRNDGAAARD